MKKKWLVTAVCTVMGMALCACSKGTKKTGANATTLTPAVATQAPETTKSPLDNAAEAVPELDYELYVSSTVLPENYKGIEMEAITEEDVDAYIGEVLAENKERQLKGDDEPVVETDIVIIDYVGYLDGVAFEGGTAYSEELEIGSGGFIEGFEDGLIGAKKGDKVSLPLTFPEDYWNADMAGKDVVFEVTVHSVAAQVLPEFTDEFASTLTGGEYPTVEAFRQGSKEYLTRERQNTLITDYLVENTTFGTTNEEYIQSLVEYQKMYYAYGYGFASVEEFEELFGAEASQVLWASIEKYMRRLEQEQVALYCVAKAENLTVTETEFTERVTEEAEYYGMTVEEFIEMNGTESLRQAFLVEAAMEFLRENMVVKGAE